MSDWNNGHEQNAPLDQHGAHPVSQEVHHEAEPVSADDANAFLNDDAPQTVAAPEIDSSLSADEPDTEDASSEDDESAFSVTEQDVIGTRSGGQFTWEDMRNFATFAILLKQAGPNVEDIMYVASGADYRGAIPIAQAAYPGALMIKGMTIVYQYIKLPSVMMSDPARAMNVAMELGSRVQDGMQDKEVLRTAAKVLEKFAEMYPKEGATPVKIRYRVNMDVTQVQSLFQTAAFSVSDEGIKALDSIWEMMDYWPRIS